MKKKLPQFPPWTTRPISPTCEVLPPQSGVHFSKDSMAREHMCDRATSFAYPAMGGGWMALCDNHAQKHHPHCIAIEKLIEDGETFA